MNIKGVLHKKEETTKVSDTFSKRPFVLKYSENPDYPEYLQMELIQANCDQLNYLKEGDEIDVHFNLKGREWTSPQGEVKYFNTLQSWKVEKIGNGEIHVSKESSPGVVDDEKDDNELPF